MIIQLGLKLPPTPPPPQFQEYSWELVNMERQLDLLTMVHLGIMKLVKF